MGRRKDYSLNRIHFMLTLDKGVYAEFRNNCKSLGRQYSDVHESLMSEWNDKAGAEIEKRAQAKKQEQQHRNDLQLRGYLESRLRDIDHRVNSGLVTGPDLERDQRLKAETQREIEELSQKITPGEAQTS